MTFIQALFLGILQGATEFLPVSSSAHLVLVPWLLGWPEPSLTFDTTVHLGTLLAVLIYFRQDVWQITRGVLKTLQTRSLADADGRLGWLILLGTVPAALIGFFFKDFFEGLFSNPRSTAIELLITGLILLISERLTHGDRSMDRLTVKDSVLIGLAQAVAIMPGISRSGTTIAAALALGIERETAARFSFLLSMPIIFGAGLLQLKDAAEVGVSSGEITMLLVGFLLAGITGYASIHYLLAYIRRHSLSVFTAYCWAFGVLCLLVSLFRG